MKWAKKIFNEKNMEGLYTRAVRGLIKKGESLKNVLNGFNLGLPTKCHQRAPVNRQYCRRPDL